MNCIFFRKFEIEVFKFQLWLKNSDISMLAIISLNLIDGNVWAIPHLMPVNDTENDSQVRKYQHQYTIMTVFFLYQHLESVKQIVTFRLENKLIGLLIVFFFAWHFMNQFQVYVTLLSNLEYAHSIDLFILFQ